MKLKDLCVLVETDDNKFYQMALTKEMRDALYYDLQMYFDKGIIQILPDEISGIKFINGSEIKKLFLRYAGEASIFHCNSCTK